MKCSIVRDLLANYIDGLNREETDREIEKHLAECPDCRRLYEKMSAVTFLETASESKNIDFLKKIRKKLRQKNRIIALFLCLFLLLSASFVVFVKNFEIALPFDANRMFVETFQATTITDEQGAIHWRAVDGLGEDQKPGIFAEQPASPEDAGSLELLRIRYQGINHISGKFSSRAIWRNGQSVSVVYYCYTKTLWDSLFYDSDLAGYTQSGSNYGKEIYGDSYESPDYLPQMREIYYLPLKNLSRLDSLSDEEFDAWREEADLIWKGVI